MPIPNDLTSARRLVQQAQMRARIRSVELRPPPPEPTTCCGRGCNGCVWEGYFAAVAFWLDDAQEAMSSLKVAAPRTSA